MRLTWPAAISSGKIAGAALDVYAQSEPLGESPLRDLDRAVVLTPHLGLLRQRPR
jgi:D-3-phosphoglycerate dehydrogenase